MIEPPPHLGFGSEEDSLGSFLALMPKVPKPDFKKLMEMDGMHLRYMYVVSLCVLLFLVFVSHYTTNRAALSNPSATDKNRKFVLTYHLQTDQISVFERPERNAGFVGGK